MVEPAFFINIFHGRSPAYLLLLLGLAAVLLPAPLPPVLQSALPSAVPDSVLE